MNRITIKLLARRYMGLATSEDVVAWAMEMLEEGYDTESLGILAGMAKPLYWQEIEQYLRKAISELGWAMPANEESCLRAYVLDIARDIVDGRISPGEGCAEIYRIVLAQNYPEYLRAWIFLDEGLDPEKYAELSDEQLDVTIMKYARRMLAQSE